MKVLCLGTDNSILKEGSPLRIRSLEYSTIVEKYYVLVPSKEKADIILSDSVKIFGSGGKNKIYKLVKLYKISKRILMREKFDIISVQDTYYIALIAYFLSRKHKIGLEIQVHGFEKFSGLRKALAKYILPRANSIRCVSQRLKRELILNFKIEEEKITVVPVYVEPKIVEYKREKNSDENFIFLTVGRLVKVKNISMQIEAMAEVIKKYPKSELWIIGDGKEKENLKFKIKNLNLESNIKLLGWQENLDKFYNQADAFLLTSNYEGWGMVVIEAAFNKLPIIMTSVGCADEVIKNNISGIIMPNRDKNKLLEAMVKIIEDKNLRINIGRNAYKTVISLPKKEQILNLYIISWKKALKK